MRITEKKENGFYELKEGEEIYGEENGIRLVQIVGQLEDIEDDLGIDLVILFKANNDGVYYKKNLKHYNAELDFKHKCIRLSKHYEAEDDFEYHYVMFKGYGKTWALTKEELE